MNPGRILILRSDNIGDAVLFSGALRVLRAHWPGAQIDFMGSPAVLALLKHCPHVDNLVSDRRLLPWEPWRRRVVRGSWAFERILLSERVRHWWYPRYDLVLYPVSAPTEPYLRAVRLMQAGEKWGYSGDQMRLDDVQDEANRPDAVFSRAFVNRPEARWQHELDRTREFLTFMGISVGDLHAEVWLASEDHQFARDALPTCESLGFFLGASSPYRQWPVPKWIAAGAGQAACGQVVLFGGPSDCVIGESVRAGLAAAGRRVLDLTGKTTINELAACIARCRAVVSNDSSGLHLAVAQHVPAVGILGGYHFGRYYPWGDAHKQRVANVQMDCYHCNDACIYHDWRCVTNVPVDLVLRQLNLAVEASP